MTDPEVQPPADIIRAATVVGARLVRRDRRIRMVTAGARADLLVLDRNPLEDIGILADPDQHLLLIITKGGGIYRNRL